MFKFTVPGTPAYLEAIQKARRIIAARTELELLARGPMLEFLDAAALGVALDAYSAATGR